MNRLKALLTLATLGMLLLSACEAGQVPNVTLPNGNANVQLLSNQQAGVDETANRAGVIISSDTNSVTDDGTADQGSGDVQGVAPTSTAVTPASDDGTADQGPGDVLVVPTEIIPAQPANDDGTPDQGPGDVPATGNAAANIGSEAEFTGVVTAVGNGFITIDGQNVFIGSGTEVEGTLEPNSTVKVHVFVDGNGALSAREVEVLIAADGTVIDDNGGHHDGSDDGTDHDINDDHGGQSNSGSDDGSSTSNSGPSDSGGQSGSGDNSGSGDSGGGHGGGGDDGSGHH